MKLDPSRCPACGGVAEAITEAVAANTRLEYDPERGEYDYAGESDVIWDTQETVLDEAGRAEVSCGRGHPWRARLEEGG